MADFKELSMNELDNVAGGTLNNFQKSFLKSKIAEEKRNGKSKAEIKAMVPGLYAQYGSSFPGVTEKDLYDYIDEVYDTV